MEKLTHEEACKLIEDTLARSIDTLLYIRKKLERPYNNGKPRQLTLFDKVKIERANLLCNINWYGAYLHGMRIILLHLRDRFLCDESNGKSKKEEKIYNKAIFDLIMSSTINLERFVDEEYEIRFTDHEWDKKGKLKSCRAYFAKKTINYIEIK